MEKVAGVITQVVDYIRYDQCSETNQREVFEDPFPKVKMDP
jgi:hypothetical protein